MTIRRTCLPRRRRRRSALSLRSPSRKVKNMSDAAPSVIGIPTGVAETITVETDIIMAAEAAPGTSPRSRLEADITAHANRAAVGSIKRLLVIASARRKAAARILLLPSHVLSSSSPRLGRPTPSSRTRPQSRTRRSNFVSLFLTNQGCSCWVWMAYSIALVCKQF